MALDNPLTIGHVQTACFNPSASSYVRGIYLPCDIQNVETARIDLPKWKPVDVPDAIVH
jgi:hypothetical protein